jgi:hypothetical protein
MESFSQIEVKESRNTSSLLPIKLALMISDLDLFAMVSGHVCADVTWLLEMGGKMVEVMLNFWKGTAIRPSGLLRVNCEAELLVT